MTEAVIVATARSPIGRAGKGSLAGVRPDDLASQIVTALLGKVPDVTGADVEDLVLGCAQPMGEHGWNVARVVASLAGLEHVPASTVNRGCASSLEAIAVAAHAIKAGAADCVIAGGVECVSRYGPEVTNTPPNLRYEDAAKRTALRANGGQPSWTAFGEFGDMYIAMGQTAENVREVEGVSRQDMDEFAKLSQDRAQDAIAGGFHAAEITPIRLDDGTIVDADDCPRAGTTLEKLASLPPAFRPDGEVTAGNSCPLNDGAAAVLVMSDSKAAQLGLRPLARVVATGLTGLNPEIMGLGPVEACARALARAGLTIDDIDLVELNEAFAAQALPSARRLDIPMEKLNVHGGAIALGHPFGQTGARLMTTLIHGMHARDVTFGMETMCVGGGQGMAMIVERLS